MLTKQISLTMPKKLYDEAAEAVELTGHRSVQELTLDLLRKSLAEDRRLRRIEADMRKGKRIRMTKEEALAYLRGL